jgi:hypothetical protein
VLADPWNKAAKPSVTFEKDDTEQLDILVNSIYKVQLLPYPTEKLHPAHSASFVLAHKLL